MQTEKNICLELSNGSTCNINSYKNYIIFMKFYLNIFSFINYAAKTIRNRCHGWELYSHSILRFEHEFANADEFQDNRNFKLPCYILRDKDFPNKVLAALTWEEANDYDTGNIHFLLNKALARKLDSTLSTYSEYMPICGGAIDIAYWIIDIEHITEVVKSNKIDKDTFRDYITRPIKFIDTYLQEFKVTDGDIFEHMNLVNIIFNIIHSLKIL